MWTRREFLTRSSLAMSATAGTCLAFPGDGAPGAAEIREAIPDGSASRGMITTKTEEAIRRGLAFLHARRDRDGSFGTVQYRGNVAVTSLCGLAFMAGGHQPGRGPYGDRITRIEGILNGTCNFILSKMEDGAEFAAVLKEAQALGYAEADPTEDVSGFDARAKLVILSRIALHATHIRNR